MSTSRILVTGGASGIGAAIARHWANLGHDVTITDVNDAAGRSLATELGCAFAHLAPAMVARGSGDIVVTASMASIYPIPPDPIYGLSKHAVSGFVKSLAPALFERGVCLSAICPFFVDTPLVPKEQQAQIRETGFDGLTVDHVVEAAQMAIAERGPAAHWVVFPGQPISRLPEPTLG